MCSPRGDSNEYTQYTIFNMNKKNIPNLHLWAFSHGTQERVRNNRGGRVMRRYWVNFQCRGGLLIWYGKYLPILNHGQDYLLCGRFSIGSVENSVVLKSVPERVARVAHFIIGPEQTQYWICNVRFFGCIPCFQAI